MSLAMASLEPLMPGIDPSASRARLLRNTCLILKLNREYGFQDAIERRRPDTILSSNTPASSVSPIIHQFGGSLRYEDLFASRFNPSGHIHAGTNRGVIGALSEPKLPTTAGP